MDSVITWFSEHPSAIFGFLGGVFGSAVYHFLSWRWKIVRRNGNESH